jgi:hypothetical protein
MWAAALGTYHEGENGDQRAFDPRSGTTGPKHWYVKAVDTGPHSLTIGLINRKDNFGPIQRARAYSLNSATARSTSCRLMPRVWMNSWAI